MKKITLLAALLGSAYFANAQVGIGTPTPHASAILDVTATDKGVLIPRVALKDTKTQLLVAVTQAESLLVYNTATANDVTPGFYYWNVNKWERIVNQSQLDTAITNVTNLQGDVTKIKALLDAAYGSNNLGETPTTGAFGGMVFTPATGTYGQTGYVAPVIEYVKWNATTSSYDKVNVTSQLIDLIHGNETKTKVATVEGKQFYFAEDYVGTIPTTIPTPLPDGMYLIDVIGDVVNNFSDIINSTTVIKGAGGTTIKQYFESLGAVDGNTAYFNNTNTAITVGTGTGAVSVPAYTFYLKDANGNAILIDLATIVKSLETETLITRNTSEVAGEFKIDYKYFNETKTLALGAPQQIIDVNADLLTLINGNTIIRNAISNVLNAGGNVYYGDHDNSPTTPDVFYTINPTTGAKTEIIIPVNIDQLITTINNTTVEKRNELKLALGDKITTNNTSVFTGNTITIGGTVHYIYKGNFTTTVNANSAVTTGVTLDKAAAKILSLDLRYNGGMVANVTTMSLSGATLAFNIGTGNMYQVLGTADITANVIIEFASTDVPAGVNP